VKIRRRVDLTAKDVGPWAIVFTYNACIRFSSRGVWRASLIVWSMYLTEAYHVFYHFPLMVSDIMKTHCTRLRLMFRYV
jgi:hypothetical protein